MKFRKLRADEIDCRISTCNQYGVGLLLYKDARCDMNILDETVGTMNWQRFHSRDNANCIVSIWDEDKKQWIAKEDTGTESYTEREKGLASDSFKRACFNWGIGRELYTAPDMWVRSGDLKTLKQDEKGKWTCRDYFAVKRIEYNGDRICYVEVENLKNGGRLSFGYTTAELSAKTEEPITEKEAEVIDRILNDMQKKAWLEHFGKADLKELTAKEYAEINEWIRKAQEKKNGKQGEA